MGFWYPCERWVSAAVDYTARRAERADGGVRFVGPSGYFRVSGGSHSSFGRRQESPGRRAKRSVSAVGWVHAGQRDASQLKHRHHRVCCHAPVIGLRGQRASRAVGRGHHSSRFRMTKRERCRTIRHDRICRVCSAAAVAHAFEYPLIPIIFLLVPLHFPNPISHPRCLLHHPISIET